MPNSAARFTFAGTGGASPSLVSTLDLIKLLLRGGGALEVSGPENEGFRPRPPGDLLLDRSSSIALPERSLEGVRIRGRDPDPGSEGRLIVG